jgi:hypothetical protein
MDRFWSLSKVKPRLSCSSLMRFLARLHLEVAAWTFRL